MGRVKDDLIAMQTEEMEEWIREQADDDDISHGSMEWNRLADEYSGWHEAMEFQHQINAETDWYNDLPYSQFNIMFRVELGNLRELLESAIENHNYQIVLKMIYVHAVAAFEALLWDQLKSIVSSNRRFLVNAVESMKGVKNQTIKLSVAVGLNDPVQWAVFKVIDNALYHKVDDAIEMYRAALGIEIDIEENHLSDIMTKRHDLVHRNGKTITGDMIELNKIIVENAISTIEEFANKLEKEIHRVPEFKYD
ncbi:MAG: hypothetical protein JKX76_03805 [Colwellia sp.]|nr:hypothetical protein [Colwellia sp.]